jgi:hypothetical protein
MNSYNLTNLDLAAKKALQDLLRPNHLVIVEPWLTGATPKMKRQLCRAVKIMDMVFDDIKPIGANAFGKPSLTQIPKESMDACQQKYFIRRSNSEVINRPQRVARDHFRDHESIQTNGAVQRYFITSQDGVAAQPFAKCLKREVVSKLEEWQVYGRASGAEQAEICAVLRTLVKQVGEVPGYTGHVVSMTRTQPGTQRGPMLYEYSQRFNRAEAAKRELIEGKYMQLQRAQSEPTLFEKEMSSEMAKIKFPGGDIPKMMDPPTIQYMKAQEAAAQCKINFAGGAQDLTTTYERTFIPPPPRALTLPNRQPPSPAASKEPWKDGTFIHHFC